MRWGVDGGGGGRGRLRVRVGFSVDSADLLGRRLRFGGAGGGPWCADVVCLVDPAAGFS